MTSFLFIHPPVAKPGEPPAGIARLQGMLTAQGLDCASIDANLQGQMYLLHQPPEADDRWTKSAVRDTNVHLDALRTGSAYKSIDHYNRIVRSLNRILTLHGRAGGWALGLADCTHAALSTARSRDLLQHAEIPEGNPFYEYYRTYLIPQIEKLAPKMIGLSVNFLSQAFCAFALTGMLHRRFPDLPIIFGGGLITSWMRSPGWRDPFQGLVYDCIEGPGESYFKNLFHLKSVVAAPDFQNLSGPDYFSPGFVLPYNTSSGCYWRQCSFCPECAEESRYEQIPHEQVFHDLTRLCREHHPSLIHFLDNALAPSFLNKFMAQADGTPWYGYMRFTEQLLNPGYCRRLKKSGCSLLKLGLESGSQDVLDEMRKGICLESVSVILNNLKEAEIPTFIYLLFGTPRESETEARRTMAFVLDHEACITYINPAIFNMPIAGDVTMQFSTRPFSEGDLSLYVNFDHPAGWDRLKVRHFLDREFKRNPCIAKILSRTPKIMTSNHAPFFQAVSH